MQEETRTVTAAKNIKASFIGIFIHFLYSFVTRKFLILILGKEYVGISSLFGNITAVISLLDFGAGSAAAYILYKPLAKGDHSEVTEILSAYRKLCRISALLVFAAGAVYLPHVSAFSSETLDEGKLGTVFLLHITAQALGYVFSDRRILLFSDRKNYICQTASFLFGGACVIASVTVLMLSGSYEYFLIVQIVSGLAEDAALCVISKKQYPDVDFSFKGKVSPDTGKKLRREIIMIQPTNIGETLLRTTDNFLTVYLFGVAANGVYSNYNMLLSYASLLSTRLIGTLTSSVGNLGASASKEKAKSIFDVTFFASYFLVSVCTCVMCVLAEDFISLWLGAGNLLPQSASYVMAALFFSHGMRRSTLVFRDAYGLYKKEKLKPFAELALSLAASYFLGKKCGITGIYAGQLIAEVCVCMWYEPYVLYKYGFSQSPAGYYITLAKYASVAALSCVCAGKIAAIAPFFIIKLAVCIVVPVVFNCFFFHGKREFTYALDTVKKMVFPKKSSRTA